MSVRTELFLCLLLLTGLVLWFTGFIYSAEIAAGALVLLALLYFPLGFYFFPVHREQNLVFSILAGSLLFMAPVSLLFNLFALPNAKLQTGIGICVLPLLLYVTVLLFNKSPAELRPFYRSHLIRIGAWLLIVTLLYAASPLSMPKF